MKSTSDYPRRGRGEDGDSPAARSGCVVINRISSWVVHILSLFAMCLVVGGATLMKIGKLKPAHDEGTAAHLFQIAIALLLPAGLVFLLSADWRKPLRVALRLV